MLLVGGCGGSSSQPLTKTEYVKQMKTIGRSLSTSINSVASVTSPKDAATALGKVQDDLRTAADQMKKISPPKNIEDQHDKLTQAVYDFADQLDPIIDKLEQRQPGGARRSHDAEGVPRPADGRRQHHQSRLQDQRLEPEPLEHRLVAAPLRRRLDLQLQVDLVAEEPLDTGPRLPADLTDDRAALADQDLLLALGLGVEADVDVAAPRSRPPRRSARAAPPRG